MKNKILIHKNYNLAKIYQKYFIALIPLMIYGFYKNGILLYLDHSINFINAFKPILLPLIGALSGLFVNFIATKELKFNPLILYGLIVGMIMPISTNLLLFAVFMIGLLFLSSFLETKISFNCVCFVKLLVVVLLLVFKNYQYANVVELSQDYAFSFVDIIFGRGVGGICSSSIVWVIVGFIYLLTDYYYKKEIPIYSIISYVIVNLITLIFIKDVSVIINNLFASSSLFAFVFIAPISNYSSYTPKGKLFFGILIGILSAILTIFIGNIESSLIAIFIVSLLKDQIDKYLGQKFTK